MKKYCFLLTVSIGFTTCVVAEASNLTLSSTIDYYIDKGLGISDDPEIKKQESAWYIAKSLGFMYLAAPMLNNLLVNANINQPFRLILLIPAIPNVAGLLMAGAGVTLECIEKIESVIATFIKFSRKSPRSYRL